MVEVVGFGAFGGDAVDIEPGEVSFAGHYSHRGLFEHFAGGGGAGRFIFGFDMAAGSEPAIEAAVMDEQEVL